MIGGFVRSDGKVGRKASSTAANQKAALAAARDLGPRYIDGVSKNAKQRHIEPSGKGPLYVLLSAPDNRADNSGLPHRSKAGAFMVSIAEATRGTCRHVTDFICRTLPESDGPLDPAWVEAYRQSVDDSIRKADPGCVLLAGRHAMNWALGAIFRGKPMQQEAAMRGRVFRARLGGKTRYCVCTFEPAWASDMIAGEKRKGRHAYGRQLDLLIESDYQRAYDLALQVQRGDLKPNPVHQQQAYQRRVKCVSDPKKILVGLRKMRTSGSGPVSYDLETRGANGANFRPYGIDCRIPIIAVARNGRALSFPVDHSRVGFTPKMVDRIFKEVRLLLESAPLCVAQNSAFEQEWLGHRFGEDFLFRTKHYCTQRAAYFLDNRRGCLNLNFLTRLYLGFAVKEVVPINLQDIETNRLDDALLYCGLDALTTAALARAQRKHAKKSGKLDLVDRAGAEIRAFTVSQLRGVPVDQDEVDKQMDLHGAAAAMIEVELQAQADSAGWDEERDGGNYVPTKDAQTVAILERFGQDEMHVRERDGAERTTVDAEALGRIMESKGPGAEFAARLLEWRGRDKLLMYLNQWCPGADKSLVFPDGRLHHQLRNSETETGRLSCWDPNLQNVPNRDEAQRALRRCIAGGRVNGEEGWVLASDYSQIEACVFAMLSKDRTWTRMVKEGYDVHTEWAQIVAEMVPGWLERVCGATSWKTADKKQRKTARSLAKNKLVFPAFFAASHYAIAEYLGAEVEVAERLLDRFWGTFPGVKRWQERLLAAALGAECTVFMADGRARRGPTTPNEMVNAPVQGTAAAIFHDAYRRLSDYSYETEQPWLHPVIPIHDDLVTWVPRSQVESSAEQIATIMTEATFDFINVPLTVESEGGPNWLDKQHILKMRGKPFRAAS